MTAPTPMITPSAVSSERALLRKSARAASSSVLPIMPVMARIPVRGEVLSVTRIMGLPPEGTRAWVWR